MPWEGFLSLIASIFVFIACFCAIWVLLKWSSAPTIVFEAKNQSFAILFFAQPKFTLAAQVFLTRKGFYLSQINFTILQVTGSPTADILTLPVLIRNGTIPAKEAYFMEKSSLGTAIN